jgi:hypothetical protein
VIETAALMVFVAGAATDLGFKAGCKFGTDRAEGSAATSAIAGNRMRSEPVLR